MFVGEQPGDREDLAGRPFVGPAGKLLDDALAQVGIDRTNVYVTNVVKHGEIDPSFVVTHRMSLDEAPQAYSTFRDKKQHCIKVVLDPWDEAAA